MQIYQEFGSHGHHHRPVRFQEGAPRCTPAACRFRFVTIPFQYILDRIRCDDVTEIGEYALDSVVAPFGVFPRNA